MKNNQKLHLEELQLFVQEMKNTSSLNAKKEIIKSYKGNRFIENALYYTYNPYLKYYVTSKSIEKNIQICDMNCIYDNIWDLLDALDNREYTGHDAIAMVNGFITNHMQFKNLILSIIDRPFIFDLSNALFFSSINLLCSLKLFIYFIVWSAAS